MTINDIKTGLQRRIRKFLLSEKELELLELLRQNSCFPPGHYYSPIVNVEALKLREKEIWPEKNLTPSVINMNKKEQIGLLNIFQTYYSEFPYLGSDNQKLRFIPENSFFNWFDALILYSVIRYFSPENIIEAGSGFSSSVMLDTNQLFKNGSMKLTFIEPYSDRLKSLLRSDDLSVSTILEKDLQDIPIETFSELKQNDILFIDSTHVCKTGSDLNYLFFQILPVLKPGVIVHFHDIFNSFEYPKNWVFEGRNWNEIYLIEAFLMYNDTFKVLFFNDYMFANCKNEVTVAFPFKDLTSGGSLYLVKK